MKYLKAINCIAFTFIFFSNTSFRMKPTDDSFVEVYFSDKQNISDLAGIQATLAKQEIKLNYDLLRFDKEGKLQAIEYHVSYKKVSGSDKTNSTHEEIGFIINTDPHPNKHYGIIVGSKDSIQKRRKELENKK